MWWQEQAYRFLADCLNQINCARREEDRVQRCALLSEALNRTWDAYYFYQKQHNILAPLAPGSQTRADTRELKELLLTGLSDSGATELCRSLTVRRLCEFTPQVMNHDTLKNADYDPRNISEQLRSQATLEHRQLLKAYQKFSANSSDRDLQQALIKKLVPVLFLVRSNKAHGQKTPKGPDLQKHKRDSEICALVNPIFEEIFEILLGRPNFRLAAYGTLRPNQSNHSLVAEIEGNWSSGTIVGDLDERHGYPVFTWNVAASKVPVEILTSLDLSNHWKRLDEFEGSEYERILVPIETDDGIVICNLYNSRGQK